MTRTATTTPSFPRSLTHLGLLAVLGAALASCGDGSDAISASGVIEADAIAVSSDTGGTIVAFDVDAGATVVRDEVLARLDTAAIDAQIAEADAGVAAAQAEVDRLSAGARAEELALAEAQLSLAMARWDGARRAWERARTSSRTPTLETPDSGAIAVTVSDMPGAAVSAGASAATLGATLAAAESAYRDAEGAVAVAQEALDALRAAPRPEDVRAAEARLRQARAGLDALDARREDMILRAPAAGLVIERLAEVGDTVLPGAMLLRVTDLATVTLTVYVPEDEIGDVTIGADIEASVDAYPDDTFDGVVTAVATEAEFTPRNVQTKDQRADLVFAVEVTLRNRDGRLKPGMPADVEIARD